MTSKDIGFMRSKTLILSTFIFILFSNSCHLYLLERKLDAEDKEFLSEVQYILPKEEKKIFLELPKKERGSFIEEFWKRRDPDPETEENEFRDSYINRIKKANELFTVGQSGYLTDRGMIYVLFGPPDNVYKSQIFIKRSGYDQEVWFYSRILDKFPNVQIEFIDRLGTGNFELKKSSYTYSIIQKAKLFYLDLALKKKFFLYSINLKRIKEKENEVEILIQIKIPYRNIWFSSIEDKIETTLSLKIYISDALNNKIWEHKHDYILSFQEKEIEQLSEKKYSVEIPVTITKGKYLLQISLINKTGEEETKRSMEFRI